MFVLLPILAAGAVYAWRVRDLRLHPGRSSGGPNALRRGAFYAGLALAVVALASPLDTLAQDRLFTAHMIQHLLLADLVPILLLIGLTRSLMRPAVRRLRPFEERLGPIAHPATALALYVGLMWLWHVPALYDAALSSPWVHALEHASFFTTGLAFWWFLIEPVPPRHRLTGPWAVGYVAAAKVLMGLLGVVLTFTPNVIYDHYKGAERAWGLTPLEDINLGGVVMSVEQSVVLIVFFTLAFARMMETSEREQLRHERAEVSGSGPGA
jgi:cytochrome c oxidase assembly factor CtaG